MKTLKTVIFIVGIITSVLLVGCSSKEIDFIAGESLYEIKDDDLEVTYVKKITKGYNKEKFKEHLLETLEQQKNLDVELEDIEIYGDNISVTLRYGSIDDLGKASKADMFHDSIEDYLDNNDINYDAFEDEDLLYNVIDGSEIKEEQLIRYKNYKLIRLQCGSAKVQVDGEILFASKQGEIISKDTIYFRQYDMNYILYKPSSGIEDWILWALLLLIVFYAGYLGIKWQSNKKEDITCSDCGQKNDDDAVYCKICGHKIKEDEV